MTTIHVGEHIIIDCEQRKVSVDNQAIELPERSYRLLLTLVEHAPNIVSHDQLMQAVWPDAVVSDETLKQRVSRLRKQLASSKDNTSIDYFVAERGLGYRCTAQVNIIDENGERELEMQKQIQREKEKPLKYIYAFICISVVVAALILPKLAQKAQQSAKPSPNQEQKKEQTKESESTTTQNNIAPLLTPDDYELQARQYYYRFNPAANDTAINLYHQALKIDPNYVLGYAGLANAHAQGYYQYGKTHDWLTQSLHYSQQAIEIDPAQPWGYKSYALGLYLNGQYQAAINNYAQASQRATWWASPVNNTALAQMEIGQLLNAYQNAIKAVKLGPKDPIPYLFLGLIYRDLGMFGHADNAINRAINFMPDYNLAITYQAEYYLLNHQHQQAITTANQALNNNQNNQFGHWIIAQASLHLSDANQALNAFKAAASSGGRYQLIAASYLTILEHQPTANIEQKLQGAIEQGNQWFEYPLALSALAAYNNQTTQALNYLQQAINAGLNHPKRIKNSPFFKPLQQNSGFVQIIEKLTTKIAKQRQKVIQIEQSRDF